MSSFKFLERHNKVTKREQYIFGSHLDQHFKYQIVVHSNGSIMKCRTAVNLFYLNLIHGKLFPTMICRTRRVVLLHCTALLRSKYQIGKHCTAIQILDGWGLYRETIFLLQNERNQRSIKWWLPGKNMVDIKVGSTTSSEIAWYGLWKWRW